MPAPGDGPNLGAIRAAVADVFRPAVREMLPRFADYSPGGLPLGWVGECRSTALMGTREKWTHTLPVTFAVARRGDYAGEQAALETLLPPLMALLRQKITLGGLGAFVVLGMEEGTVRLGGVDYYGLTLRCQATESYGTTVTV